MQQSTHFLGVANKKILWQSKQMNIKQIVVSIALCGFSTGLHTLPVPHIVIHKPKPHLTVIQKYVQIAAKKSGLPPRLIAAVIHVESRGNVDAVSSAGAVGLMQLTKNTAKMLHVNPWNPKQNIVGGARYLARLIKRFGGLWLGLEAYNTGPTNVAEGRVCPSAVIYATNVVRRMSEES